MVALRSGSGSGPHASGPAGAGIWVPRVSRVTGLTHAPLSPLWDARRTAALAPLSPRWYDNPPGRASHPGASVGPSCMRSNETNESTDHPCTARPHAAHTGYCAYTRDLQPAGTEPLGPSAKRPHVSTAATGGMPGCTPHRGPRGDFLAAGFGPPPGAVPHTMLFQRPPPGAVPHSGPHTMFRQHEVRRQLVPASKESKESKVDTHSELAEVVAGLQARLCELESQLQLGRTRRRCQ